MTCNGCRDEPRCPYCGRSPKGDHKTPHDISTTLPLTGRKMKEEIDV